MNETIKIEKAKVVKKCEFVSGTSEFGAWARLDMRVEWEYQYSDAEGQPAVGKQSAVVTCKGEKAAWARDNIQQGNEYNNVPYTYVNLTVRLDGRIDVLRKKDGGTWDRPDNTINVVQIEIVQG